MTISVMRVGFAIAMAGVAAAFLLSTASAGPPPPHLINIAATHAQPRAGHAFTGITVTNLGTKIRPSAVRFTSAGST